MVQIDKLPKDAEQEKTFFKNFGHCDAGAGGNIAAIDVKDGKIIRVRPMRLDWKYKPEEFNAWQVIRALNLMAERLHSHPWQLVCNLH